MRACRPSCARRRPCSRCRRRSRARRRRSRHFVGAAGDADRAAALDLGDLADDRADRAGRARDDDGLAGLGLADVEQAEVGGHAGHAERAQVASAAARASGRPCAAALAVGATAVLLHAEHAVTWSPTAKPGCFDATTRPTPPARITSPMPTGGDVGLALVHPAAHGRVEREVQHLDEHLAVARLRHRLLGELPVAALRQADRARGQPDLMVLGGGHDVLNLLRQRPQGSSFARPQTAVAERIIPRPHGRYSATHGTIAIGRDGATSRSPHCRSPAPSSRPKCATWVPEAICFCKRVRIDA